MKTNSRSPGSPAARRQRQAGFLLWLMLILVVVAVTAVVTYKIVTSGRQIFNQHGQQLTNEMSGTEIWQYDEYAGGDDFFPLWFSKNGGNPPMQVTSVSGSSLFGPGFGFQYALNATNGSWCVYAGTNLDSGQTIIDQTQSAATGFLAGDYWGSGQHYRFNAADPNYVRYVSCDTNFSTLVIERSSDLQTWTAIGTNSEYLRWTVETFVDTNAPVDAAFYRVDLVPNAAPVRQYDTQ